MPRTEHEVKNAEIETLPFEGMSNVGLPEEFPHKRKDPGSFFIPFMVGKVRIDRALCDLSASVSLMLYSVF